MKNFPDLAPSHNCIHFSGTFNEVCAEHFGDDCFAEENFKDFCHE